MVALKKKYTFNTTDELDRALKVLKERDGIPEAEAIRRALKAFLREKGVLDSPATQSKASRKGAKATVRAK